MTLIAVPVDAHDSRWELPAPTYRVSFWSADTGRCREFELRGVNDVTEVLDWAGANAGDEEVATVFVAVTRPELGLVRLAGPNGPDVLSPARQPLDMHRANDAARQGTPLTGHAFGPSASGVEVLYDTGSWTDDQFEAVRARLDREHVDWYLAADELVLDKAAEGLADLIINQIIGEVIPTSRELPRHAPNVEGQQPSSPRAPPS